MSVLFAEEDLVDLARPVPPTGEELELHEIDGREYIVAYVEGRVAGLLRLNPADGHVLGFVFAEFRRQGVGTALWETGVETWGLDKPSELSADAESFFASR